MNRYEKYKLAETKFFGEIPEHWFEYKMKYLVDPSKYYQIGDGDHGSIKPEMYSVDGDIPYLRVQNLSWTGELLNEGLVYITHEIQDANSKSKLIPDDILIAKTGATIGKLGMIPHSLKEANTTSSVGKITVNQKRFFPKFVLYSMMSKQFKDQIWIDASQKSAQPGFNVDDLVFYKIVAPPLQEQITMANFLDEKATQIAKLISNKQKLIELLKEERAGMIDNAVTKGISQSAKQKETDFDWIGNIPSHWEIKKLRFIGKCQNGISKGKEYFGSGFPFASYGDVYNNEMLPMNLSGLAESTDEDRINYSVMEGDIFFTRTSETVEEIGLTSTCMNTIDDATFSGFLIRFRPFQNILFKGFSKFYFRSQIHRKYFVKEMNLVTRASLSQDLLKNLPVLIPPMKEQIQIAEYIQSETQRIDNLISKTEKEIELMNEYRIALVSEVVTGKIKVI